MNNILNEAAEKYFNDKYGSFFAAQQENRTQDFKAGALSDAAKQYWYTQWQLEQKHNTDMHWIADTSAREDDLIKGDFLLFSPTNGEREIVTFVDNRGYGLGVIDSNGEKAIVSVSHCCKVVQAKHTQQKQVSAGVWVKASERRSDDGLIVLFRTCKGEIPIKHLGYYDRRLDVYFIDNNPTRFDIETYKIEWLDESAQQKQVSDEEIEKLVDDNFKASLADNNGEPLYTDADLQKGFKAALQHGIGDGWISVKDAPKENGYYIIWDGKEYGLVHYHKDTGWQNGFYNGIVTHWQKPSPPINK